MAEPNPNENENVQQLPEIAQAPALVGDPLFLHGIGENLAAFLQDVDRVLEGRQRQADQECLQRLAPLREEKFALIAKAVVERQEDVANRLVAIQQEEQDVRNAHAAPTAAIERRREELHRILFPREPPLVPLPPFQERRQQRNEYRCRQRGVSDLLPVPRAYQYGGRHLLHRFIFRMDEEERRERQPGQYQTILREYEKHLRKLARRRHRLMEQLSSK